MKKRIRRTLKELRNNNKLVEAQRLEQRTKYDMEMLRETGFCNGMKITPDISAAENRGVLRLHLLIIYRKIFLLFVDESHVTLPQVRAMYAGDRARKKIWSNTDLDYHLLFDNRPLNFDEFWGKLNQAVFVSATPADFEKRAINPYCRTGNQTYRFA